MRDRERGDDGAQQLAFARTGAADENAVRAHALMRRFLEVDVDFRAVGRQA